MKKLLCLILCLLMIVGCFAGCKQNDAPVADAPAADAPAADAPAADAPAADAPAADAPAADEDATGFEGQTLKVAAFEGGFGAQYWENISKAFEEAYGVTVELVTSPTIDEIVRPQIIAGEYPDVLFLNSNSMALYQELVQEKAYEDLSAIFAGPSYDDPNVPLHDIIISGLLDTRYFAPHGDGSIIMAPHSSNCQSLIYNKTLFDANGWTVPETWDEFFALGEEAKAKGYNLFTYPGLYPDYNAPMILSSLASALGTEAVDQFTSYDSSVLKTPEAIAIYENFAKIGQGYLMPGTTALNHTQSQAEFMLDKAMFIPNGDWLPAEMADAPTTEGFEWASAPFLALEKGQDRYYNLIVDGFGVMKNGANVELGKEFVRFFYSAEAQRFLAEASITAATTNFVDVAGDLLPPEKAAFAAVAKEAGAISTTMVGVDTKLVFADYAWNAITDVMNGDMTADEWREGVIDAMDRIKAGE